jgi:hypothetical protein
MLIGGLMKLSDNVLIQLFDEKMKLIDERQIHNTVTTAGKYGVMDQILASPTLVKMGWMAVGTGTPGATLLGAENARVAFTSKTRNNAVVTVIGDFPAGTGTGTLTEAGTFDVVTANTINMWMSASFGAITKGASDTLKITWTLTGA